MASSTKRVAHVLASSAGGIRRSVRYLATHPPAGYATEIVWGPGELGAYFAGVPFRAAAGLDRVRLPRADVVHVHGFEAGVRLLLPHRGGVVLGVHTDVDTQGRTARSRIAHALALRVAARADVVIVGSLKAARRFSDTVVIDPPVDPLPPASRTRDEVRRALGTPGDRVVVVTVARLHPDKNLDVFVDAVVASGAEGWVCGDGPMREHLERRCRGTTVRLLGHREDVADLLGAADVFALPSTGEAYGIAVLEAVQAGLPVVVSDAGAMRELAGDAGVVVALADAAAFDEAIAMLVVDSGRRAAYATRARARSFAPPERLLDEIAKVYDSVCR